MFIERNLKIPLRSMIERIVDAKAEFATSDVLVDKDKGRKREQELSKNEEEEEAAELLADSEPMETVRDVKSVLAKRLDLVV